VIERIDPDKKWIDFYVYRENCVTNQDNIYVKDLRIFNRELKDLIIVDNAAYSFIH